jgi:hypothetical protein
VTIKVPAQQLRMMVHYFIFASSVKEELNGIAITKIFYSNLLEQDF